MKNTALLLSLLLTAPAMADIRINSDSIKVNVDREDEIKDWKAKHKNECSSIEIGGVKVTSDGCSSKKHENSSVHGDNNPGKGHDKNKHKNDDDDYDIKIEHHDNNVRVEHYDTNSAKGKGKKNQ